MESALDKLIRLTRVTVPAHDRRDPRTGRTQHVGTYSYERHGRGLAAAPAPRPERKIGQAEMLRRGADGHLSRAVERDIPLDKIDGLEPTPAMAGGYRKGTPITQPIEVQYQAGTGSYMLYAGNHRVTQARVNGQSTIKAFVEPEDGDFSSLPAPAIGKVKARLRSRPVSLVHSTYKENIPSILANGFRPSRGEGGYGVYFTPEGHTYAERSGDEYGTIKAKFHAKKTLLMGSGGNDAGYAKYQEAAQEDPDRPDRVLARQGYDSAEYHDPWGGVQFIVFDPKKIKIERTVPTATRTGESVIPPRTLSSTGKSRPPKKLRL